MNEQCNYFYTKKIVNYKENCACSKYLNEN